MKTIVLSYNPYLMTTTMEVDGKAVAEGPFAKYLDADIPLQNWIVPLPGDGNWKGFLFELNEKYGDNQFTIKFRGRKLDLEDFKAAIERQEAESEAGEKKPPLHAEIIEEITLDDEDVNKTIDEAVKKIRSKKFADILQNPLITATPELKGAYETMGADYKAARDKEFHIVFAGTVSSGKSTLLNALVRKRILPSRDGTCTAKVFYIHHKNDIDFAEMCCEDSKGCPVVKQEAYPDEKALREKFSELFPAGAKGELMPSVPSSIDSVHVYTNLSHLYPDGFEDKFKLVLVDTPGTNSHLGNDEEEQTIPHVEITKGIIRSREQAMVVLVMDDDDSTDENASGLLEAINNIMTDRTAYAQRFLFAANKYDTISYGNSETLEGKVSQASGSIKDGAENLLAPRIFPLAAQVALAFYTNKTDECEVDAPDPQDADEELSLVDTFEAFQKKLGRRISFSQNYYLDEHCSVSEPIKQRLAARLEQADEKERVLIHSGVPSLEAAIQDYIQRYAYPMKMRALYKTFQSILAETNGFLSNLSKYLAQNNEKLADRENEKKGKDSERGDAEAREKRLKDIKKIIDGRKAQVEKRTLDKFRYQELRAVAKTEIYGDNDFNDIVKKVTSLHEEKDELKELQKKLAQRFEKAAENMDKALDAWIKKELETIQGLMQEAQDALGELKKDRLLTFDSYDFSGGVSIDKMKVAMEEWSDEWLVTEKIHNPEKDKDLSGFSGFEFVLEWLKRLAAANELDRYHMDESWINDQRDALAKKFQENCEEARRKIQTRLEGAKQRAERWLMGLVNAIEETQNSLQTMKKDVQELAKDERALKKEIARAKKQMEYLKTIHQLLNFGDGATLCEGGKTDDKEV